jgi:hypothetical protein
MTTRAHRCNDPTCWCQPECEPGLFHGFRSARKAATLGLGMGVATFFALQSLGHLAWGVLIVTVALVLPLWQAWWIQATVDINNGSVTERRWFGLTGRDRPLADVFAVVVRQQHRRGVTRSRIVLRLEKGEEIEFQVFWDRPFEATQLALRLADAIECPRVVHWVSGYQTTVRQAENSKASVA